MKYDPRQNVKELSAAQWIGGPGNALLRREFQLPAPARAAILKIVADPHTYSIHHWQKLPSKYKYEHWLLGGSFVKYRFFANGMLAAVGPFRPVEDGVPLVHEYDLTGLFKAGPNVLAVLSRGEDKGFALSLEIVCTDGSEHVIRSSADWTWREANTIYRPVCWEHPAIDQFFKGSVGPGEYPEHLDGKAYPQGWRSAAFDDSAWSSAPCFGPADGQYEICRTPPYQLTPLTPKRIEQLAEGNFLVDFGRPVFGGIELACPAGGGTIELRLGEELQPNGQARFQYRSENCYQELWTFAEHSEPLSHLGLRLFRYAQVIGWKGPFNEHSIRAVAVGAPFDPSRSSFTCSDQRLAKVWDLCKNTIAHTTADVYTDCLTRERLAYEADAYVTMLTHFCTEGSSQTARRTLAYLVRHPTWPCEWRQCFIPLFYEYLLHTGDLELVADHYDFLRDKASFHHLIKEGLIREFPQERTIDWPAIYRDGYEFGPAEAVPNAYAYWDLELLARLADWLGKEQEARSLEQAAADLRAGFNRELFDESSGLYVDSVGSRHSSLHANLFALRFGLVPPQRVQACLNLIKSKGVVCGVFTMQFLLETLFMHGEDQAAVELMTRDGNRSWLEMIHHGATATTETWISDQNANMTWCHPWASSPANLIVRHLFGLRPTAPGWSTYTFDPRPGGLQEGKLSLLTPRGWMHAGFQRQEGEYRFDLQPSLEPHLAKAADSGRSPKARPMSLSVSR